MSVVVRVGAAGRESEARHDGTCSVSLDQLMLSDVTPMWQ